MFSYFVPISLLVLAGFALGLVVGWLTWVSSRRPADEEPADQGTPGDPPEPEPLIPDPTPDRSTILDTAPERSTIVDTAPDRSTSDLPFWRVREVSPSAFSDAGLASNDVDL